MEAMSQARVRPVEYPESDGLPMAETEEHADELRAAIDTLRDHFAADPGPYVAGNNFLYWVEGDTSVCVSPDVYLVKGVGKSKRRVFKTWLEAARPSFVLEITSDSSKRQDRGDKMSIYRDELQVPEYFLFDLTRDWIPGGLLGYRLAGGVYLPIAPDARGRLASQQLGLELAPVGRELRFFRPGDEGPMPRRLERIESAEERARRAEAEVKRLREELERLRRGP
jgi:Uma2 family endonuclease